MSLEHIKGCLMGLFVGDAAGGTLEFYNKTITPKKAQKAMRMPGGGTWELAPGQVTDDSELAIHLHRALQGRDWHDGMPLKAIAEEYIAWYNSYPFDMGMTCRRAFGFSEGNAQNMMSNAQNYNTYSQANGSLMRIAPLALWLKDAPLATVINYARSEALLSHPHLACQEANAIYCAAIHHLINHPKDYVGATEIVDRLASSMPTIKEWIIATRDDTLYANMDCIDHMGWLKHALQLSIYFLRRNTDIATALELTLLKGGDTDTNAAIVTALLGALHGYTAIPYYMKEPVLKHDPTGPNGRKRPATYNISAIMDDLS